MARTKPCNLSWTAKALLALIVERTEHDGNGGITAYWYASRHSEWVSIMNTFISIGGAGDASALRGLERRGLIERPSGTQITNNYVYQATELGMMAFEGFREELTRK